MEHGFPGGSAVKNPPAMQETWIGSLNWEDPLEEEMSTHSSILAWKIPWTEEPGGLQSMGLQRVGHDWATEQRFGTDDSWEILEEDKQGQVRGFLGCIESPTEVR